MCFAPSRRAFFHHLNFQKCSENGVFFGCNIFTSRRASRHSAVQFLNISTSPTLRCLSHFDFHMCFVPQQRYFSTLRGHKALEKHSVSWLFYLFAHLYFLSSDSFSSLIFFLLPFSSLTLPTSSFPSVHIVGSLTSKLPSVIVLPTLL